MQALHALTLVPIAETHADTNSYGLEWVDAVPMQSRTVLSA